MTVPLLSVIIPTCGRPTLERLLQSIRAQAPPQECELVIVGDTHDGTWREALAPVPALAAAYAASYYGHDGGLHMVGQPQRNYGMTRATGRWLGFSQDDNIWLRGAWDAIRASIREPPRIPRLFKVRVPGGFQVWTQEGHLALGHIDADCIVTPNTPARLGQWGLEYTGDWDFIRDTVKLWRGRVQWEPALIALGRPRRSQYWGWEYVG